jgi:hypothetical protein
MTGLIAQAGGQCGQNPCVISDGDEAVSSKELLQLRKINHTCLFIHERHQTKTRCCERGFGKSGANFR